jgi:hypothetical protein
MNAQTSLQGIEISKGKDNIQMSVNLPLKYYREKDRLFYLISAI